MKEVYIVYEVRNTKQYSWCPGRILKIFDSEDKALNYIRDAMKPAFEAGVGGTFDGETILDLLDYDTYGLYHSIIITVQYGYRGFYCKKYEVD